MPTEPAYFTLNDGGEYLPTSFAGSNWGDDHLNGPAVVGLAAQALEKCSGAIDFVPARFTADLLRAARNRPTTVEVDVVRDGRRVRSAQCDIVQDGRLTARATLIQYRRSTAPPGQQWTAPVTWPALPVHDDTPLPYLHSGELGWTQSPAEHQNALRKCFYHRGVDVVVGQTNSGFVRTVIVAEATSFVTNLGSAGVGYINGDLTVALSRTPVDEWIGVQADTHWAADGVAVGTATLFDSHGGFGSGVITAVANPAAQIDFGSGKFSVGGLNYE